MDGYLLDTKEGTSEGLELRCKPGGIEGSLLGSEIGSTVRSEVGFELGSDLGFKLGSELGSELESELRYTLGSNLSFILDSTLGQFHGLRLGIWDEIFNGSELGSLDRYLLLTTEGEYNSLCLWGRLCDSEGCVLGHDFGSTLGSRLGSVLYAVLGSVLG